jgi:hypothetical protein
MYTPEADQVRAVTVEPLAQQHRIFERIGAADTPGVAAELDALASA